MTERGGLLPWLVEHGDELPALAFDHVEIGASVAIAYGLARIGWRHARKPARRRDKARGDLAAKVGPVLGVTPEDAARLVQYPPNPEDPTADLVITYPRTFQALSGQVGILTELINLHLPGDWELAEHSGHRLRYVHSESPAPPPELPASANFVDDGGPVDLIPFAVNAAGEVQRIDLTDKTPHVLVSASTGWGKTTILTIPIAWVASRGGLVDVCDPKRIGYVAPAGVPLFRDLPNVRLHTNIAGMVGAIVSYREEMQERYKLIEAGADLTDPDRFPTRLLVLDEMGSLIAMMKSYYADEIKQRGMPAQPPWLTDVLMILWQGRAAKMHVITAAQQASAQVLINSDARDQYALKIAAGPQSRAAWGMMFGDEPIRVAEARKGRAMVGIGPELQAMQLMRIGTREARALAERGGRAFDSYRPPRAEPPTEPLSATLPAPAPVPALAPARPAARPTVTARVPQEAPLAERSELVLTCKGCGVIWPTKAKSGGRARCPDCNRAHTVPDRDTPKT